MADLLDMLLIGCLILVSLASLIIYKFLKKNPDVFKNWALSKLLIVFGTVAAGSAAGLLAVWHFRSNLGILHLAYLLLFFWLISSSILIATHRLWLDAPTINRITTSLLRRKAKGFERLIPVLNDKDRVPIGLSLNDNSPFFLPVHQCLEHILICGATGVGKTSNLITMLMHNMKHGRPSIIIDPKGELADIDLIRTLAKMLGREKDLLVFSLSNPASSCSYDFVKLGTPEQQKSKLLAGFGLSHEHYGSLAAKVLGTLFDVLDYLGETNIDVTRLGRILNNNTERMRLEDLLNNEPESQEVDDLLSKLASIRKLSSEDISGLVAAVDVYSLREFRGVFTPGISKNPEIDLIDVLQTGKIAYFQLNTNGYGDLANRFGRILVQDIALVSSMIQTRQIDRKFEYAAIFIDEFGSFVSDNFANIQKMIRSAHMGLRLFYQGMADLRVISAEFEDQVMGNTLVKIILRQDVDDDAKKWSATAGTVDATIRSFQTTTGILGDLKTGMGNLHEGKKVKIEFDVFKELGKGQAVVIDKGRKIQDVIQLWDAKNPEYLSLFAKTLSVGDDYDKSTNGFVQTQKAQSSSSPEAEKNLPSTKPTNYFGKFKNQNRQRSLR